MGDMKMNPVVHFEMPYKTGKRVSGFYSKVFGWQMTDAGEQMGNYILAITTDSTDKGPKKPGSINGGFYVGSKSAAKYPSFVISVDDLKVAMAKIKKAGGRILSKPVDIPGVGLWVSFKDTEGNRVSILQPSRM